MAENLLKQKFEAAAPNEIWVSDITYIPTDEGWLYCAAHKDLFQRRDRRLCPGCPDDEEPGGQVPYPGRDSQSILPKGLIHHSDRGSQYCSPKYRKLLTLLGMEASMSRKGNCYDNAPMESFWGTLKNELGLSSALWNKRRSDKGDHRVHRGLLQPAAATEAAGLPIPCGI